MGSKHSCGYRGGAISHIDAPFSAALNSRSHGHNLGGGVEARSLVAVLLDVDDERAEKRAEEM